MGGVKKKVKKWLFDNPPQIITEDKKYQEVLNDLYKHYWQHGGMEKHQRELYRRIMTK